LKVLVRVFIALIGGMLFLLSKPSLAALQSAEITMPFSVRTVDAVAIEGTLVSLSLESGLVFEVDGERQTVATSDLISITRVQAVTSSMNAETLDASLGRDSVTLELVGGDRVFGRVDDAQSDTVVVDTQQWGKLEVPLERLARVVFSAGGTPAYADSLKWFRQNFDSPDDRVLLTNGDVVRGFIAGIHREGIRLEIGDEVNVVPLRLAVAAQLVHPPADHPKDPHAIIGLRDGQRLTVVQLEWQAGKLEAKAASGETVKPASDEVQSIEFQGGRWEWLSTRAPASAQHVPMLSMEWKHHADRNVLGGPLRVAGRQYERGIGVHSRSVLKYDLGGTCKEFVTWFGMDDESGRLANTNTVILVDGQQRFERVNVVAGVLHGPVRVDVSGAKRLELVVDFGLNGDIQDRFDWIEPGLVK
jgi:hypothetical protein